MTTNLEQKQGNRQISGIDIFLSKLARNEFKSWHYTREHRTGLIISLLLKFGTMIILAFCGYYFLYEMISGAFAPSVGLPVAWFMVIAIEFLIAYLLAKTVKFFIKQTYTTAGIYLVFAVLLYGTEFYSTTHGLASRQAEKADQTNFIASDYNSKNDSLIKVYNNRIEFIKSNPAKFAPDASGKWNARRLSNEQLAEISALEAQKDLKLQNMKLEQNAVLVSNTEVKEIVYTKYYSFVSVVMFIQLIVNAFLMFSYSRIYMENNKPEFLNEKLVMHNNTLQTASEDFVINSVYQMQRLVFNSFQMPYDLMLPSNDATLNTGPNKQPQTIGFIKPQTILVNNENKENQSLNDTDSNLIVKRSPLTNEFINTSKADLKPAKVCPVCSSELKTKHWKAVYCSEKCRIDAWEQRTGKTFTKGPKH